MAHDPIRTMKRSHQIFGAVLLVFSAAVAWESLHLKFYTPLGPGPGFFPFWLALALGFLAVVVLYQATFRHATPMPANFPPTRAGILRIGATVAAIAATIVLMNWLGFRMTMLGFYIFMLVSLGRQRLFLTLFVALLGSFGVYQVFVSLLDVPLPIGRLGF